MTELGRVLDPGALDDATGARGRMSIAVPTSWSRATIEIFVPGRVACARCAGGGCDGCSRSGAIRLRGPAEDRTATVTLPAALDHPCVLRLVRPLGLHPELEQLLVEIRAAAIASPNCRLLELRATTKDGTPSRAAPGASEVIVLACIGFAVAAALIVALAQAFGP